MDTFRFENNFFFEEALHPICYLDENGFILKLNLAYSQFFGYEHSILIGESFLVHFSNLAEEEKDIILEEYKFLYKNNQSFQKKFLVFDKQKNSKDVEFISKIEFAKDNVKASILFIREISLNEKIQSELKHLNLLPISFSKIKVNSVTLETEYIFLSESFQNIFEVPIREIQKNPKILESAIHPNDIPIFRSLLEPNFNTVVNSIQYRILDSSENCKWIESKFFQNQINEVEFVIYSISYEIQKKVQEKKRLQDKIRNILFEKNETYKLLFDNSPIGILLIDKLDKVIAANEYMENYFEIEEEVHFGKSFAEYIAEDSIEAHKNYAIQFNQNEIKNSSIELKLNIRNKKENHFTIYSNSILNQFGKFLCRIDFLVDTEPMKESENRLLELVKSKNDILEIVAHDIRSPIGAIQSLIEIILSKNESEGTSRLLEMVQTSLIHVMDIAKSILNVAEIDDNEILVSTETIELNIFIRNIISNFHIQALQKQIEFVYVPSEEEFYFSTNSGKLKVAISNILSNSIKFSFPKSKIKLVLSSENSKPKIQIIDTGMGMDLKTKESLFQKFSKARSLGTKGEKSTGLGLYISKEIIDKLGGSINVETEQDKGSIFSIHL